MTTLEAFVQGCTFGYVLPHALRLVVTALVRFDVWPTRGAFWGVGRDYP